MSTMEIKVSSVLIDDEIVEHQTIKVVNGVVIDIFESLTDKDELQGLLVPGFIDVQVNGGGGKLFNNAPTIKTLKTLAAAHQQFGTTGLLPTLITDSVAQMSAAADAIAQAIAEHTPSIMGIHFEGPHLSTAKRGVHSRQFIRELSAVENRIYQRKDIGAVVVTVAPENISPSGIRDLVSEGIQVCLGHSNATYEQTMSALEAGATGFTHLYNAMSAMTSREPGMVGAALHSCDTYSGLIADNIHVHPGSMAVAINASTQVMLVTDAMSLVGTEQGSFEFFGETIHRQLDTLRDAEGRLAGSMLDMNTAVKNISAIDGVSLINAVTMASKNPANFLKLGHKYGSIKQGHFASLVLLDNTDEVSHTWVDGKLVYDRECYTSALHYQFSEQWRNQWKQQLILAEAPSYRCP